MFNNKCKLYKVKQKNDNYDYHFYLIDIPEFLINNIYDIISIEEGTIDEFSKRFDDIDFKYIKLHSIGIKYLVKNFDDIAQHYGITYKNFLNNE